MKGILMESLRAFVLFSFHIRSAASCAVSFHHNKGILFPWSGYWAKSSICAHSYISTIHPGWKTASHPPDGGCHSSVYPIPQQFQAHAWQGRLHQGKPCVCLLCGNSKGSLLPALFYRFLQSMCALFHISNELSCANLL